MRALVRQASLCALIVLGGCATGGAGYLEFAASAASPGAEAARLLLYRAADTPQYAMRSAAVRIDAGEPIDLAPGTFHAVTIPAGTHRIVVDMWDVPGRCELTIEVQGATERFFEVSPRGANALATLPMLLVPVQSFGTLLASGAVMMGGLKVESAGQACGGAFQVVEQSMQQVQPHLASLRASR